MAFGHELKASVVLAHVATVTLSELKAGWRSD